MDFLTKTKDRERYEHRSIEAIEKQASKPVVREWEQVRGNILAPTLRRAIILGDPGFGKSWLLRYEGWQLATTEIERLKKSLVGTSSVQIPLFVRLSDLAATTGPLLERIKTALCDKEQELPHVEELWPLIETKVKTGDALLLLDGWDEVRKNRHGLKKLIQTFARRNPRCRIFLTSRIAGYETLTLGAQEWELVLFTQHQIKQFIDTYFDSVSADIDKTQRAQQGAALVLNLKDNTRLMSLGGIPLMLSLLCRLFWENQKLPNRRVEIYKDCVWGLVYKWKYGMSASVFDEDAANTIIELLAELSLSLFLDSPHLDHWSLPELKTHLNGVPDSPLNQAERVSRIDQLIRDGVLVREGDDAQSPLRFIHRTFQEYLAATALANRVNDSKGKRWETKIEAEDKRVTIYHLIDKKAWDPNWLEVTSLLTGKLNDPEPLLNLLSDAKKDDLFRHRLGLGGACLTDLAEGLHPTLSQKIAQNIFER